MKVLCRPVRSREHTGGRKRLCSSEIRKKTTGLFGSDFGTDFSEEAGNVNRGHLHVVGQGSAHKTMEQLNHNHTFNLKQREILSKLLAQAKEHAQVSLESDSDL